jgi:hypothetical protein
MKDFILNNQVIITIVISVVALSGGVPGILSIWNHWRDKPAFHFKLESLGNGICNTPQGSTPFVILSGTASNPGKQPLSPITFNMRLRFKGKEQKVEKMLIEPFLDSDPQLKFDRSLFRDLLSKVPPIPPGEGVQGSLLFLVPGLKLEDLDRVKDIVFDLTCTDIFGRSYSCKNFWADPSPIKTPTTYPPIGITYYPKPGKK